MTRYMIYDNIRYPNPVQHVYICRFLLVWIIEKNFYRTRTFVDSELYEEWISFYFKLLEYKYRPLSAKYMC